MESDSYIIIILLACSDCLQVIEQTKVIMISNKRIIVFNKHENIKIIIHHYLPITVCSSTLFISFVIWVREGLASKACKGVPRSALIKMNLSFNFDQPLWVYLFSPCFSWSQNIPDVIGAICYLWKTSYYEWTF